MFKYHTSVNDMVLHYMIKDQRGATAIEYGLIAGLIAAVLVGALSATGTTLRGIFFDIERAVRLAAGGG